MAEDSVQDMDMDMCPSNDLDGGASALASADTDASDELLGAASSDQNVQQAPSAPCDPTTQACLTQDLPDDDMDDSTSDRSTSQQSNSSNIEDEDMIRVEEEEDEAIPSIAKIQHHIDLCGDNPVESRRRIVRKPIDWSKVEEVIELSEGKDEPRPNATNWRERTTNARIKTEPGCFPDVNSLKPTSPNADNDTVALGSTSSIQGGNEPEDRDVGDARTTDVHIVDSDAAPEVIKEEQRTPSPLWERPMGNKTIDLDAPFGGLRPRNRAPNLDHYARMQRILMDSKDRGQAIPRGASAIFRHDRDAQHDSSQQQMMDQDGDEWMHCGDIHDDLSVEDDFKRIETIYKAKKQRRKNTAADDITFKRALNRYKQHNARLAYDAQGSDDSQAEEDSEHVTQDVETDPESRKRSYGTYQNEDDPLEEESQWEQIVREKLQNYNNQNKTPKLATPSKQRRDTKEWKEEREKEEYQNLIAGIENALYTGQANLAKQALREFEEEQQKNQPRRKKKSQRRETKLAGLMSSDLYNDSNANVEKENLPQVSEKKKKEFLTELIANIPVADRAQAKSDRAAILEATKILMKWKVKPDGNGNWKMPGMKSSLFHYQVQAAAFMKERELKTGDQDVKGGLLCDEMGLGKTVEIIATMVAHRQQEAGRPKTTLIICPPALLRQWREELERHVDANIFRQIIEYKGSSVHNKGQEEILENADVVLTTYPRVLRSYPLCLLPKNIESKEEKLAYWHDYWDKNRCFLHRAHFFRVVLDEADKIKNHLSQTSIACRALMAKHRWAVSGTPIHNRLVTFPFNDQDIY